MLRWVWGQLQGAGSRGRAAGRPEEFWPRNNFFQKQGVSKTTNKISRAQSMAKAATEPPEVAGKRLQAKLDALCPRLQVVPAAALAAACAAARADRRQPAPSARPLHLQPAAHPRGYPISRDEVEQLCEDDAELSRLHQVGGCRLLALRPIPGLARRSPASTRA